MPIDVKPNEEFLKFISIQKDKGNFQNVELLLNLERKYPGIFVKVMLDFDKVRGYRESLDKNGKPINVAWDEALEKFYLSSKYEDVTQENEDIAVLFGEKGLSQETFESASELRKKARILNVPEHILGKPLVEGTILDSIERIRKQTEDDLLKGKEMIEEIYNYEWLSKNDPHNSILGLFCSCCGNITSQYYGKDIARASVIAQDVQNIVIRNSKGEIISKGTIYINKQLGYGVINDFEINKEYKEHENLSGRYSVDEKSKDEERRELIFQAFQRGLKAFIEEYDMQNPQNPLNQINIGMGYNKLKRQVERFKKATNNLTVPAEYNFQDASVEQYILYKREQREIQDGEER